MVIGNGLNDDPENAVIVSRVRRGFKGFRNKKTRPPTRVVEYCHNPLQRYI